VLIKSLVPTLEPTSEDYFCEWGNIMDLGALYFTEEIGTVTIHYEVNLNAGVLLPKGFVDRKLAVEHTDKARRVSIVRLFPNVQFATDALNGENVKRISRMKIAKYRGLWHYPSYILGAIFT